MMSDDHLSRQKKALRAHALALRHAAHLALAEAAAQAIRDRFLDALPKAGAVAGYWPIGDELDIRPLLTALAGRGVTTALPVVVEPRRPLEFRRWQPGDVLEAGAHGTWHPRADAPLLVPRVVLVPLLAFDGEGRRLGYGGGYYDRTLQALRTAGPVVAVGVGYAAQRLDAVPHDANDQPLDIILTEHETWRRAGR